MGYACYDTPLGEAGYDVQDVCNLDGCEKVIDRGVAYLCGDQPGYESEDACGNWFCDGHLYVGPNGQRCGACLDALENPKGFSALLARETGRGIVDGVRAAAKSYRHDRANEKQEREGT